MPKEPLSQIRDDPAHHATVVFVHGFTGDGLVTWRNLADRVAADTRLSSWDLWTITYGTSWLPDVSGIWTADADLTILAKRLGTDLGLGALARYRAVVLIAHSMGGLIVQKALLDFPAVATRTNAVVLFGTPSDGLVKARTLSFWKRQLADMASGGPFVAKLRSDWRQRFAANAPFSLLAVAGERDQFVPPESSIKPFPEEQQAVVFGDHISMLSPPKDDRAVVELIARRIAIGAPGADVGDAAARAIERGDFQRIIADNYDNYRELDRKALVRLAIALDAVGRRGDAYDVLAKRDDLDSDALGVMAGRLKRRWLLSGRRQGDADASLAHYAKGYELAVKADNLTQAYYHGINLAFLEFVFHGDRAAAREKATKVLEICRGCEAADQWIEATKGEASLILGDEPAAFEAYRRFVGSGNDPWKVCSTYLHARNIAAEYGNRELARKLGEIFQDQNP
jgi:predicted alpha/beta hydrolase family esterase